MRERDQGEGVVLDEVAVRGWGDNQVLGQTQVRLHSTGTSCPMATLILSFSRQREKGP